MKRHVVRLFLVAALLAALPLLLAVDTRPARKRVFTFTYAGTVTGLMPGEKARVWLPVPPSNGDQQVKLEAQELPAEAKETRDPLYGNAILYFEATADKRGEIAFSRTYKVTRNEVRGAQQADDDALVKRFLEPDKLGPLDGKPLLLLKDKSVPKDPMDAAKVLYEVVNRNLKYDKSGTGWGRGDVAWVCDSKHGNCTDFHSLFISLARAHKIPAKYEIGFSLPPTRGEGDVTGYHCWAKFRVEGKGWVPVDISEANKNPEQAEYYFGNLTEDLIAFSVGRDITLAPKQDGEPLNYFLNPYVEVGGKPHPADTFNGKRSFKDVE